MGSKGEQAKLSMDYFKKAYSLQLNGHLDKAALWFKKSIQQKPSPEAYTFLGWIYGQKGLYETAIEYCRKAIEINPDIGNPYNDIGAYLIRLKRFDEARQWLEKALQAPKYDNYCYAYFNLGHIYEIKGKWREALKYYKKALTENPDYKAAKTAIDRLRGKFN